MNHLRFSPIDHPADNSGQVLRRRVLGVLGLSVLLTACGGGGAVIEAAVAPTLTISTNAGSTVGAVFTVRFEFSAPVAAFPSGSLPFALQGGRVVAGSFQSLSATVFTVDIAPNSQSAGTVLLSLPAGAFADATGQSTNAVAYNFSQAFNTVLPDTVPWVDMKTAAAGDATGPFTVNITFNLDVGNSFTLDDLKVTNATPSDLSKVSATNYTLLLTPPTGSSSLAVVELLQDSVVAVSSGASNTRSWAYGFWYRT
jgi:hypothetical protein